MIGEREGVLRRLLDDFKFEHVRAAYRPLALLLHHHLPILPDTTIVVGIPTTRKHIRQRGYDQCHLIAKEFARLRNLPYSSMALVRRGAIQQRGKTKKERFRQATRMFATGDITTPAPHLVIDDIFTTGATLAAAANVLTFAGVKEVNIAVIARQTLD